MSVSVNLDQEENCYLDNYLPHLPNVWGFTWLASLCPPTQPLKNGYYYYFYFHFKDEGVKAQGGNSLAQGYTVRNGQSWDEDPALNSVLMPGNM